ncbi:MAG: Ig-like domain-containing protein, partial [Shewanella sp.]
ATANYSDYSSYEVAGSVTWESANTNIANVTQDGVLTGLAIGETTLTATMDGVTSNEVTVNVANVTIASIQVTPSPVNLIKGQTQQLKAILNYSDNTTADVTHSVEWEVADQTVATVTSLGLLNSAKEGTTTVKAKVGNVISNEVSVNVSLAKVTSISLTAPGSPWPHHVWRQKGLTWQLKAIADYNDGSNADITDSATWDVADESIAVVSPQGVLTGVGVGKTELKALMDGVESNLLTTEIVEKGLIAIAVTPESITLPDGHSAQLTAIGTYTDNSTQDLTDKVLWKHSGYGGVAIDKAGKLTATATGKTIVWAQNSNFGQVVSNEVNVTVTPAVLVSVEVTPSPVN